ncbi:uncharacterized protein LOC141908545 [Tubulanus polymorphus]|uniref:uncharacterized protein LOC141908545 n=1 Tax=Tubulanus polymorphus TaxID=672921 RepID=UPI003DA29B8A
MATLPPWKLALIEKKRRHEEDERRRHLDEMRRLAEMPAWKRDLLLKKKAVQQIHANSNNIVYDGSTNKYIDNNSIGTRNTLQHVQQQAASENSQRSTPDSGFDENDATPETPSPVKVSSALRYHHREKDYANANITGTTANHNHVTTNGVVAAADNNSNDSSEEELPYQPGFVHKLLDKFAHLTVKKKKSASGDGTESLYRKRSASVEDILETDNNSLQSKKHSVSVEELSPKRVVDPRLSPKRVVDPGLSPKRVVDPVSSPKRVADPVLSPKRVVDRERAASVIDYGDINVPRAATRERATSMVVDSSRRENLLIKESSAANHKRCDYNANPESNLQSATDEPDCNNTVRIISGNRDNFTSEELPVRNLVSSVRNIFESGAMKGSPEILRKKKSRAPAVPVVTSPAVPVVTSPAVPSVPPQTARIQHNSDLTTNLSSKRTGPPGGHKANKTPSATTVADATKKVVEVNNRNHGDDNKTIVNGELAKIREAGQSWVFGGGKSQSPSGPLQSPVGGPVQSPLTNCSKISTSQKHDETSNNNINNNNIRSAAKSQKDSRQQNAKESPSTSSTKMVAVKPVDNDSNRSSTTTFKLVTGSDDATGAKSQVKPAQGAPPQRPTLNSQQPRKRHAPPVPSIFTQPQIHKRHGAASSAPKMTIGNVTTSSASSDEIPVTNIDDVPITNIDDVMVFELNEGSAPTPRPPPPQFIDTKLDLSGIVNDAVLPSSRDRTKYDQTTTPPRIKPCNIEFIGANVKLEKSSLQKTKKQKGSISFDSDHVMYEYPSEQSLLDFFASQEQRDDDDGGGATDNTDNNFYSNNNNNVDSMTDSGDDDSEDVNKNASNSDINLLNNPALGSTSGLGSYKGKYTMDYEFGTVLNEPSTPVIEKPAEPPIDPEDMQIKPAEDEETFAWSDSANADMLF